MSLSSVKRQQRRRVLTGLREHLIATAAPASLLQDLEGLEADVGCCGARLVFDDVDEVCEGGVLVEATDLRIGGALRENVLIEGENLAVLEHLVKGESGRIDVIYIDPPYNTGMHGLGYEDRFGVGEGCRHSRWLSAMKRRLDVSRALLSEAGVLFLHLDDNEFARAFLLCAQVFGEANVSVLIWPKTDVGFDQNRIEKPFHNVKCVHEYVLVAYKDQSRTTFNPVCLPSRQGDMESILRGLGTTSSAKDELASVFGDRLRFQTPKPMRLIKELIRAASTRTSLVLDFFAGSGTTGHAVMDLNREDGGERRFVLVNNNENSICREVTYERLKWAIAQGYDEGLRYFVLGRGEAGVR